MTALLDSLCFAAGVAVGLLHFLLLRWNTRLFITAGVPRAIGIQALRLVVLAGVLLLAARFGAVPLLLTALGVMMARQIVVRRSQALP
ncbi:MAG TPA: ATP synthase subunit I [Acetobacteraceae bacterium]|nr:ATP synthase subunit I [Acetobacteraceae bacterium]